MSYFVKSKYKKVIMPPSLMHSNVDHPTFDLHDNSIIGWAGWWTTWNALRRSGWEIAIKPKYTNWRQPICSEASREKVYLRHPATRMIGRISRDNALEMTKDDYILDFMTLEHNHRVTPPKVLMERDLTADDIPKLLKIILKLQEQRPKKRKKTSNIVVATAAEILILKTA